MSKIEINPSQIIVMDKPVAKVEANSSQIPVSDKPVAKAKAKSSQIPVMDKHVAKAKANSSQIPVMSKTGAKANSNVPKTPVVRTASLFKQQKLKAYQPIFNATSAIPVFLVVGVIYIPIGIAALISSNNIKEFIYDYTYCTNIATGNSTCADFLMIASNRGKTCYCKFKVIFEEHFHHPVFVYYGLTNFYQNFRRYIRSRDDRQLHGDVLSPEDLKSECTPFRTVQNKSGTFGYAPCGTIANSIFNDTFKISLIDMFKVSLIRTGIAWTTDKGTKFRNPSSWSYFTKPSNWQKPVWELDLNNTDNNGYLNEDLHVWMRTSLLPDFRKLYRRIGNDEYPFLHGLPSGSYTIRIEYRYPVANFDGTKSIIISTTSSLGGKNPFFGIGYLVMGCVNILLGLIFSLIVANKDKKLNNYT